MSRKGVLELSVTGVVVLIIALVVLGSTIFFIRSFFGESTALLDQQLNNVKEQLRKSLEKTGEPVVLDFGSTLALKRGSAQVNYIGMRNDLNGPSGSVCHLMVLVCLRSFSGSKNCGVRTSPHDGSAQDGAPVIVGGVAARKEEEDEETVVTFRDSGLLQADLPWVTRMLDVWQIPNKGVDVNPVTFQITEAPPDTYQMELWTFYFENYEDCNALSSDKKIIQWQSKRFLLELS